MDRRHADAAFLRLALRWIDRRKLRLEFGESATARTREVFKNLERAQAFRHTRLAAMGRKRLLEIDLVAKDPNRVGRTRITAIAAHRLQQHAAERLEFDARATVKACDFVQVFTKANVGDGEMFALRIAHQSLDSLP